VFVPWNIVHRQRRTGWTEVRGLIHRGPREYLIVKPSDDLGAAWQFPGGRAAADLGAEECLRRWCLTNLGLELSTLTPQAAFDYGFGSHIVSYRWFHGRARADDALPLGCAAVRWVAVDDLAECVLDVPSAAMAERLRASHTVR